MKNFLILILLLFCSCGSKSGEIVTQNPEKSSIPSTTDTFFVKDYKAIILDTFFHNTSFYTQGLVYHNGLLYESAGNYGESKLIRYNKNFQVDTIISLNNSYFAEGITIFEDKIFQLTWLNQKCFVYDVKTLKNIIEFTYSGEGGGLTSNDSLLFLSDGSSVIRVISPINFNVLSNLRIRNKNNFIRGINEIQLVDDILYANIFMQDKILMIDIRSGNVVGEIDISHLRRELKNNPTAEVSNGIAYNKDEDVFYLTGKNWNKIFVVRFEEK